MYPGKETDFYQGIIIIIYCFTRNENPINPVRKETHPTHRVGGTAGLRENEPEDEANKTTVNDMQ